MYTRVSQSDFIQAFKDYDRMDNFSYEGLTALYDWFEQYEEDTGEAIELDVIAICCDFTEMSWDDVRREYSIMLEGDEEGDEEEEQLLEWLADETIVVYSDNDTVLFQAF